MKNNILLFLLGIFVTISIAATIPNTGLLTIKPVRPSNTIVLYGRDSVGIKTGNASQELTFSKIKQNLLICVELKLS